MVIGPLSVGIFFLQVNPHFQVSYPHQQTFGFNNNFLNKTFLPSLNCSLSNLVL